MLADRRGAVSLSVCTCAEQRRCSIAATTKERELPPWLLSLLRIPACDPLDLFQGYTAPLAFGFPVYLLLFFFHSLVPTLRFSFLRSRLNIFVKVCPTHKTPTSGYDFYALQLMASYCSLFVRKRYVYKASRNSLCTIGNVFGRSQCGCIAHVTKVIFTNHFRALLKI